MSIRVRIGCLALLASLVAACGGMSNSSSTKGDDVDGATSDRFADLEDDERETVMIANPGDSGNEYLISPAVFDTVIVRSAPAVAGEPHVIETLLKGSGYQYKIAEAPGRGEFTRYPRLSDQLMLPDGGRPDRCGLCGKRVDHCRKWIEGDDADDVRAAGVRSFYMCGQCVQMRMEPHPRIYAPAVRAFQD